MGFNFVSFLPTDYQVKLGLIMQVMRVLYLRVRSGRNIVWLYLFPDHAHVLIALPFIPVTLTDHLGSFGCLRTDAYRGKNDNWLVPYRIFYLYTGKVYCILFQERLLLKGPTGLVSWEFIICCDQSILLPFTLK
jgi:hypothetical protein